MTLEGDPLVNPQFRTPSRTPSHLRELVKRRIRALPGGDRWLVRGRDLRALLAHRLRGSPPPPPHSVKVSWLRRIQRRFDLPVLIETGTFQGSTVLALHDRFQRIVSIELDPELCQAARARLVHLDNVTVLQGDSGERLDAVLGETPGPCLFWLDAHYSGPGTAGGSSRQPLLAELAAIGHHYEPGSAILIDDVRLFGANGYPSLVQLRETLTAIDPNLRLRVRDDALQALPPPSKTRRHPRRRRRPRRCRELKPLDPQAHAAWRRDRGDESLRLDYPLGPDSVVLDLGGFRGQWASDVFAMYGCRIEVFEPLPEFAQAIRRRFARNPRIRVHPYGLAAASGSVPFYPAGDASSTLRGTGRGVDVDMRSCVEVFEALGLREVDLMKINIEGGEFDLLEQLLDTGLIERIRDVQVQFHSFVDRATERRMRLQQRLSRTHRLTYEYPFVWENWRRLDAEGADPDDPA